MPRWHRERQRLTETAKCTTAVTVTDRTPVSTCETPVLLLTQTNIKTHNDAHRICLGVQYHVTFRNAGG